MAEEVSAYDNLPLRQRLFVDAYIGRCNGNASAAAIEAGYSDSSPSVRSANACRLLKKPEIRTAISERLKESAMSADEVLARLTEMGRGIGTCFWEQDGEGRLRLKVDAVLEAGLGHLIHEVADTEHGQKIKFYDAQAALVQLGRYHKLFSERMEHTGPNGGPLVIREVTVEMPPVEDDEPEDDGTAEPLPD